LSGERTARGVEVRSLTGGEVLEHADALGAVLADCVAGGASVSFMLPFSPADGAVFFRIAAEETAAGRTILLAAFGSERVVGTVQVRLAMPPNQPHRGELAKMLVHRAARRRGVGAALLRAAEHEAARAGKTLLCLDTVVGGDAERLYRANAWSECGIIPDFALWPGGGLCATRVFYKRLESLPA